MTDYALPAGRRPARGIARRLLVPLSMLAVAGLACAPIAYMVWPQAKPVSPDAPSLSSIGYGQVVSHLRGETTLADAIESTQRATRRLARRQAQWFRAEDRRITWVDDADDIDLQANIFTGACTNVIRGERR